VKRKAQQALRRGAHVYDGRVVLTVYLCGIAKGTDIGGGEDGDAAVAHLCARQSEAEGRDRLDLRRRQRRQREVNRYK